MNRIRTGRALALAALALAAHAGTARAQQLPPAQQIVDRYVQAIGGRPAFARLASRHMVAEMSMSGMSMQMETFTARPNKMVAVVSVNGMQITSGYDGQVAWTNSPMTGPRLMEGAELKQVLDNAQFDRSFDPSASSTSMTTVGERTVDGRACWDVKIVSTNGIESTNCFDKETGLLVATRAKQVSQMGEMEVDSKVLDYKDFDGVKIPTRIVSSMMGQEVVMTVKSVSHAAIPAAKFELPAEIKALQR
ncbi:MAG TPA: DUF4412 domain-containing protein [Longimicrobium sp.]|nr:DUF4412 domain-containing protein [Longimicrobium sp.]